jgi:type IV secretory pathway VirB6-like protein
MADPTLWKMIGVYMMNIRGGYVLLGAIMIFSIVIICTTLIHIVVGYVMAYVMLCILIGLAPLFIGCILFEKTKGMFEKVISLIIGYAIEPVMMLLFFLFIYGISDALLEKILVPCCWKNFVTLNWKIPIMVAFVIKVYEVTYPLVEIKYYVPSPSEDQHFLMMLSGVGMYYMIAMCLSGVSKIAQSASQQIFSTFGAPGAQKDMGGHAERLVSSYSQDIMRRGGFFLKRQIFGDDDQKKKQSGKKKRINSTSTTIEDTKKTDAPTSVDET